MDFSGCSRDCGGYFMDFSGFSMDVDGNFWWGVMIQWWFEGDSMVILNIHGDFARSNFEPPTYGKWLWPDRVSVDISRHYVDYWFGGFKAFKSIWILLILTIFFGFKTFFLNTVARCGNAWNPVPGEEDWGAPEVSLFGAPGRVEDGSIWPPYVL